MTHPLLTQIEAYVTRFFETHPRPELTYHNIDHTVAMVRAADELATHLMLSETDYLTVMAAAWFHDLGYLTGPASQHEVASSVLAADFLEQAGVPADTISAVQGCIWATKMPQTPTTQLEEILCDADLFHLGQDEFKDDQKRLRKELEATGGKKIPGGEWRQRTVDLLRSHQYFTPYAQTLLERGQANNLRLLIDKQIKKGDVAAQNSYDVGGTDSPAPTADPVATLRQPPPARTIAEEAPPKKKRKKRRSSRPNRGIETLFRTTSTNHLQLSEIADSKANIMISVNAIMVSVVVSVLPRRIEENPALVWPTVLFLAASLLTIVFAILTTRPNVTHGTFSRDDIRQKRGNLLFFGNFHQMSLSDYEWGVGELMKDGNYLYGTLTRDIYHLGIVLGKKYKLLRVTYTIFMVGFVISVLAFLVVFIFFSHALPIYSFINP